MSQIFHRSANTLFTLPRHVASEAEHERVQAPCSRDFQLLAAKQV
jgi:hypothetical protein